MNIDIVVFYRPPTSPHNGLTTTAFLDERSTLMSQLTICKSELIVVGDVNIHLDNQTLHHTVECIQSLEKHGLQKHIQVLKDHHGLTLDVPISRDTSTLLTDIEVEDINPCNDDSDLIRDSYSIECTIQQSPQLQNREIVLYRNVKQIDIDQIPNGLKNQCKGYDTSSEFKEIYAFKIIYLCYMQIFAVQVKKIKDFIYYILYRQFEHHFLLHRIE